MKPREFDELVKHKFDEGAFEYKPQNWERLAEQLDGREKKRGLLVWWMPLIGVAASVALAMGVPLVLHESGTIGRQPAAQYAKVANAARAAEAQQVVTSPVAQEVIAPVAAVAKVISKIIVTDKANELVTEHTTTLAATEKIENDPIVKNNNLAFNSHKAIKFDEPIETFIAKDKDIFRKSKKKVQAPVAYYTFKEHTADKAPAKVALSVLGGVNYSNQSNGYIVGATARRMINDKVYVEGDVAFVGTNSMSRYTDIVYDNAGTTAGQARTAPLGSTGSGTATGSAGGNTSYGGSLSSPTHPGNLAARGVGAVTAKSTSAATVTTIPTPQGRIVTVDKAYSSYYAQVTPTIGYKIMKRMSVGVGPDFQQMIGDNRPAASPLETGNIQEAPMFDVGFMGKTEYAISRNVKAAVYYREGINNIITPMNRFIDRNYVQFQIKCAILNK